MEDITNKFFQLVRYALDEYSQPPLVEADEWELIIEMAKKQSILGVAFESVQRMDQI